MERLASASQGCSSRFQKLSENASTGRMTRDGKQMENLAGSTALASFMANLINSSNIL